MSSLPERVFGLETEYAVNFYPVGTSSSPASNIIVKTLKDVLTRNYGIEGCDFLINGAKFYHDVGHAEWAGPECHTAREAAIYDKAADYLLAQALPVAQNILAQSGYEGQLLIIKNNVDFSSKITYGCHENYLMLRDAELLVGSDFLRYLLHALVPFLVTRQILVGSGFLGATKGRYAKPTFALSQRAAFIDCVVSSDTLSGRPILNLGREREPLARGNYRRLHLILGDANLSGWSTWLKLGTTGLILRMVEDLFITDYPLLEDPVTALHTISADSTCTLCVPLRGGGAISARDIQWYYYQLADKYLNQFECSNEEDELMVEWHKALRDLEEHAMKLSDRADWAIKKRLLDAYLHKIGGSWNAAGNQRTVIQNLRAYDLRYHDISRTGLYHHLSFPDVLVTEQEIQRAQETPPQYTRARIRSEIIRQTRHNDYKGKVTSWQNIAAGREEAYLPDPLAFDYPSLYFDEQWWRATLEHEDHRVRARATMALTWHKQPVALAMQIDKAQNDEHEQVRLAAVKGLGYRADKSARDVLILCLNDTSCLVNWAAEESLERVHKGIPQPPPTLEPAAFDEEALVHILY
jgi:proteasome accessory factor A